MAVRFFFQGEIASYVHLSREIDKFICFAFMDEPCQVFIQNKHFTNLYKHSYIHIRSMQ